MLGGATDRARLPGNERVRKLRRDAGDTSTQQRTERSRGSLGVRQRRRVRSLGRGERGREVVGTMGRSDDLALTQVLGTQIVETRRGDRHGGDLGVDLGTLGGTGGAAVIDVREVVLARRDRGDRSLVLDPTRDEVPLLSGCDLPPGEITGELLDRASGVG